MSEQIKGQQSLVKSQRKERVENGYRKVTSNDGSFSPHIRKEVNEVLSRYCRITNQNKTRVVEMCIVKQINSMEKDFLESMTKEQLIDFIQHDRRTNL